MAASSPAGWDRYTRINVQPERIEPRMDLVTIRSPRFGGLPSVSAAAPELERGSLHLLGVLPEGLATIRAARHLVSALGMGAGGPNEARALRPAASLWSRAGRTIVLQQHVDGHDVVGARLKVHFGRRGEFAVIGRPLDDVAQRTPRDRVATNEDAAGAAAARAFDLDPSTVRETRLQSFPMPNGRARWAWRVAMVVDRPAEGEPPADVRAYLDADTLELLLSFNIASALRGQATVFLQNPGRTPNVSDVRLWDLGPVPDDRLSGRRLVVDPATPPPAMSSARDFRASPVDPTFDQAGAFFHLRNALRYYTRLSGRRRFARPPFRPVRAVVRDRASRNNAYFLPTDGKLRFGDFDVEMDLRPSARSADVLYHELGHAISDNAAKLGRSLHDSEARGLSEGYSDYFASSALGDPRVCEWVAPAQARDSSDPSLKFPPGYAGPEHATGAVWAAVLWGIRSAVGQRDADRIIFDSLYLLTSESTFVDAHRALLTVNAELLAAGKIGADCAPVIDSEWQKR